MLSLRGAGSLQIQATDYGLITCEDILINRQIPELPHRFCPHPLPGLQPPPTPTHEKEAVGQQYYTVRGTQRFQLWERQRGSAVWSGGSGSSQRGLALLMASGPETRPSSIADSLSELGPITWLQSASISHV